MDQSVRWVKSKLCYTCAGKTKIRFQNYATHTAFTWQYSYLDRRNQNITSNLVLSFQVCWTFFFFFSNMLNFWDPVIDLRDQVLKDIAYVLKVIAYVPTVIAYWLNGINWGLKLIPYVFLPSLDYLSEGIRKTSILRKALLGIVRWELYFLTILAAAAPVSPSLKNQASSV